MSHIEIHWCETARDAARLEYAGLPRLDIFHDLKCTACHARVGEVNGTDGTVFWKPCGLVLSDDSTGVICRTCFKPVDKSLTAR